MSALTQCCCGCSLRTGTIIIAALYLIWSLVEMGILAYILYTLQIIDMYYNDSELKAAKTQLVIGLAFAVIQAVCAMLPLIGAIQGKAVLFVPWMLVQSIMTITMTVVSVAICGRFFGAGTISRYPMVLAVYICAMLNAYIILVVSCFYQSLRERAEEKSAHA